MNTLELHTCAVSAKFMQHKSVIYDASFIKILSFWEPIKSALAQLKNFDKQEKKWLSLTAFVYIYLYLSDGFFIYSMNIWITIIYGQSCMRW